MNLIYVKHGLTPDYFVDIYVFDPYGSILPVAATFNISPNNGTPYALYGLLANCMVWGTVDGTTNDLYYMRFEESGIDLSGFFYGGVDFFEWDTSNNCIDNADAIQLIERLDISCSECGSIKSSTFVRPSDIDVLFDGVDDIETGEDESILIV
jgi:hypothetical protein